MNIHSRIRPALIYSLLPLSAIFFHSCGTLKVPLSEGRSAKDAAILFDKQAEKVQILLKKEDSITFTYRILIKDGEYLSNREIEAHTGMGKGSCTTETSINN